jgi:hypothetical protein
MLNFNREQHSGAPINLSLNELIEASEPPSPNLRRYLGASAIGGECLRKVQYEWFCDATFPARTKDIFERGHFFEELSRQRLIRIGFQFAPTHQLRFQAVNGWFRGHADGLLVGGPELPDLVYPCLWEHKALSAKGWRAIERDGLTGLYATYGAQICIYQSYLNCLNPALMTIVNADSCERLHILVPFDPVLAQSVSDRAVLVIEASRAGEVLPRHTDDPEDWRCRMCAWREHCWSVP